MALSMQWGYPQYSSTFPYPFFRRPSAILLHQPPAWEGPQDVTGPHAVVRKVLTP